MGVIFSIFDQPMDGSHPIRYNIVMVNHRYATCDPTTGESYYWIDTNDGTFKVSKYDYNTAKFTLIQRYKLKISGNQAKILEVIDIYHK